MKKKYQVLLMLAFLLSGFEDSQAQIANFVPELFPVSKCTDGSYMQLDVTATGTLVITFPPGITYRPGSVTGATEVSYTANTATFNVTTPGTVQYYHLSNCATSESAGYTDVATMNGFSFTSNVYNIAKGVPQATVVSHNPTVGTVGVPSTRIVQVTNGGLGDVIDWYYQEISTAGSYLFDLNSITFAGGVPFPASQAKVTSGGGYDTLTLHFTAAEMLLQGNNDIYFDGNFQTASESFDISYKVTPTNCGNGYNINSSNRVFFGCFGDTCSDVSIVSSFPLNITNPPNLAFYFKDSVRACLDINIPLPKKFQVVNTGGAATDLSLMIMHYFATDNVAAYNSFIDTSSIKYQINNGILVSKSPDSLSFNGNHWGGDTVAGAKFKPSGVKLNFPIVGPGDTLNIYLNTYSACEGNDNCITKNSGGFNSYEEQLYIMPGSSYKNACKDISYNIPAIPLNFYFVSASSNLNFPSDVVNGDTADFNSFLSIYRNVPVASGAYFEVQTFLPNGYTVVDSAYGESTIPSGTYYWPSVNTLNGNIYTSRFYYPVPPGFQIDLFDYKLKLRLDCAARAATDNATFTQKLYFVQDSSCACKRILTCEQNTPLIHCPLNCPEGFNNVFASTRRKNIGLPDANNDGVADAGPYDFKKMNFSNIMWGDTIEYTYTGILGWNPVNGPFNHFYAETYISGFSGKLSLIDADVTQYNSNGTLVSGPTIYPSSVSGDYVKTDFSALAGSASQGDSFIVRMRIRFIDPDYIENSISERDYESRNYLYASRSPNPPDSDTTTASGRKFCDKWSGTFHAIPYYYYVAGNSATIDGCDKSYLRAVSYFSIGKNGTNNYFEKSLRFPYEVRQWTYLDKAKVLLPQFYNYNVDSVNAEFFRTAGVTTTSYKAYSVPFSINGDTVIADIKSRYAEFGGSAQNPIGDDGWLVVTYFYVTPKCSTNTIAQPIEYHHNISSYLNRVPTGYNYAYPLGYNGYNVASNSVQLVAAGGGNKNIAGKSFAFNNLQISNQSTAAATHAYVYFKNSVKTQISKVTLGGVEINPDANGYYNLNGYTAGELKNLAVVGTTTSCTVDTIKMYYGWDCKQFPNTPSSTLQSCSEPLLLILNPLPAKIDGTVTPLRSTPPNPATGVGQYGLTTVDMCTPFPVEIVINSALQGTIYDVLANVKLPIGVKYVPNSAYFETPTGSAPVQVSAAQEAILAAVPVAGTLPFDLELMSGGSIDSLQGTLGLPSSIRKCIIRFLAITDCNVGKGRITAQLIAKRACGTNAINSGTFKGGNSIRLKAPAGSFNLTMSTGITSIQGCGISSPGFVTVSKTDNAVPTTTDSILLSVPSSVNLLNFTCNACTPSLPAPNIVDDGIVKTYSWNYPAGNITGSFTINFEAQATSESECSNINEINASVTQLKAVYCQTAGVNCPGASTIEAGSDDANFSISLSDLNVDSLEATIYEMDTINTINATAVVSNTSNLNAQNYLVVFGYDIDGNGVFTYNDDILLDSMFKSTNANTTDTITKSFNTNISPPSGAKLVVGVFSNGGSASSCICNADFEDALMKVVTYGSIGNYVWEDKDGNGLANEPASSGINGVKVYLYNSTLAIIDSTVTKNDANGNPGYYMFDSLASGTYYVGFPPTTPLGNLTQQSLALQTDGNSDANVVTGLSPAVVIVSDGVGQNKNNTTIDAGYRGFAAVGNYVWFDANGDGIQNQLPNGSNELPAAGVTINLYDINGNLVGTRTTNAAGYYLFDSLLPGTYYISSPGLPGYSFTLFNQGTSENNSDIDTMTGASAPFELVNGEVDSTLDVGLYKKPTLSILSSCKCHNIEYERGDPYEFVDTIKVEATPGADWYISSQTGMKLINALNNIPVPIGTVLLTSAPGVYYYEFAHNSGSGYAVTVTNGIASLSTSNLCDTVSLVTSLDTLLNICVAENPVPLTATYRVGGNVIPGTVKFHVIDYTLPRADSNVTVFTPQLYKPSDSVIVYAVFTPNNTSLYCPVSYSYPIDIDSAKTCSAALGNFVWVDSNQNGIQDPGEPGLGGVGVNLYSVGSDGLENTTDDILVGSTTTGSNGSYLFPNLEPGRYYVQFLPNGYHVFTSSMTKGDNGNDTNSDADSTYGPNYGLTPVFALSLREFDTTVDAGLIYRVPLNASQVVLTTKSLFDANQIVWQLVGNAQISKYEIHKGSSSTSLALIHTQDANSPLVYLDKKISEETSYYQVIGINNQGDVIKSNISAVTRKPAPRIEVFPNPATSSINVKILDGLEEDTYILIRDEVGKVVKRIAAKQGAKQISISIDEFASGIYMLNINNKNYKFIKL